eukprot:4171812-Prymnesium_polylepis.1
MPCSTASPRRLRRCGGRFGFRWRLKACGSLAIMIAPPSRRSSTALTTSESWHEAARPCSADLSPLARVQLLGMRQTCPCPPPASPLPLLLAGAALCVAFRVRSGDDSIDASELKVLFKLGAGMDVSDDDCASLV